MSKRQEQFSGTMPVTEKNIFDTDLLAKWLVDHVPDFTPPFSLEQFKGGQSNPTFKINFKAGTVVLRKQPPGDLATSAHAVDREYRIVSALGRAEFPVPPTYGFCSDRSIIGTSFYVMDFIDGRIHWDASFPDVPREMRPQYFDAMNRTIAELHKIRPADIGIADFGKAGNYIARQVRRWSSQYEQDKEAAGSVAYIDKLIDWLPRNIPAVDETSIVHGDFRHDNIIFQTAEPDVRAVLDWELSTLGDPLADFTYHLMVYYMPSIGTSGLLGANLAELNIPTEREYVESYCERTGRAGIPSLHFYLAYNFFRIAAIIHGIRARMMRGSASSEHAGHMIKALEPLSERAWSHAKAFEMRGGDQ